MEGLLLPKLLSEYVRMNDGCNSWTGTKGFRLLPGLFPGCRLVLAESVLYNICRPHGFRLGGLGK